MVAASGTGRDGRKVRIRLALRCKEDHAHVIRMTPIERRWGEGVSSTGKKPLTLALSQRERDDPWLYS